MSSPTRVVLNFPLLSLYNAGNKACTTMPNIKKIYYTKTCVLERYLLIWTTFCLCKAFTVYKIL